MVPKPAAWTASRNFGIVIDAGSSGSRVQVYSWLEPEIARQLKKANGETANVLSKVEKGVEAGDGWHFKVEPGISTFGANPPGVAEYLKPLIEFASSVIPPSAHSSTPIYLLATAGMRLLPREQQDAVLQTTCIYLQSFDFLLPDCTTNVRVISGEEEGLYGWIAVNYLMDGFDSHVHLPGQPGHDTSSTYGFLDMGGASTQIAFEPSPAEQVKHADNLLEVRLRLLSGRDVVHPVFVTTWLGFGTNQARERYVEQEVRKHHRDGVEGGRIEDPCLPKSLLLSDERHAGVTLKGTGDFDACLRRTGPLLNKEVKCLDEPCLFNGVHVPAIDFDVNHFIGISEYWYSTQEIWAMGGLYDFVTFERNAKEYCSREWDSIMADHKEGLKWRKEVELSRLETQCFKAAWVINVLHEGIGIPRLALDAGGKGDGENQMLKGVKKAKEKGVLQKKPGKASFQSIQSVGDVSVSWTLGKMVLEVSRSAPSTPFNVEPSTRWTDYRPSIPKTLTSTDAIAPFSIFTVVLILLYILLSPRRRHVLLSLNSKRRASHNTLPLSMDEPGSTLLSDSTSSSSTSSSSASSPIRTKLRYAAYTLSTLLRSFSRPSSNTSYSALPLSSSSHSTNNTNNTLSISMPPTTVRHSPAPPPPPPPMSTTSTSTVVDRPGVRPLRPTKSTPFLRGQPTLMHSSSSPSLVTMAGGGVPSGGNGGSSTIGAAGLGGGWNDAPDLTELLMARGKTRPTTPAGAPRGGLSRLTSRNGAGAGAGGGAGGMGSGSSRDGTGSGREDGEGRRSAPGTPPVGLWDDD